jgi:hypothetical protein
VAVERKRWLAARARDRGRPCDCDIFIPSPVLRRHRWFAF